MNIRQKIVDKVYDGLIYPKGLKPSQGYNWMFKDNCLKCLEHPIEYLSNADYMKKYPAKGFNMDGWKVYFCERHLREFISDIKSMSDDDVEELMSVFKCGDIKADEGE